MVDYSKKTRNELYEIAKRRNIAGRSGMKHDQLVAALSKKKSSATRKPTSVPKGSKKKTPARKTATKPAKKKSTAAKPASSALSANQQTVLVMKENLEYEIQALKKSVQHAQSAAEKRGYRDSIKIANAILAGNPEKGMKIFLALKNPEYVDRNVSEILHNKHIQNKKYWNLLK